MAYFVIFHKEIKMLSVPDVMAEKIQIQLRLLRRSKVWIPLGTLIEMLVEKLSILTRWMTILDMTVGVSETPIKMPQKCFLKIPIFSKNALKILKNYFYAVLIRGSVYKSLLLCVHQKRDAFSLSLFLCSSQGSALSLLNFVAYPLCFLTA